MKKGILVILFYLVISLFFFREILVTPGLIIGGDWGLPATSSQMRNFAASGFFTWRYTESLFGSSAAHLNDYPFRLLVGLLSLISINGELFNKFLLIFLFTLAGFTMYRLCRYLSLREFPSILGGLFFITTPLFFNYAIIGWQLVLLSLALLPLVLITFTKSVKEQKFSYAIITGLLYSIAMLQSQSLVWYPLALLFLSFFIVSTAKDFFMCLRSLAIIFFIFLGFHISWFLALFIFPEPLIIKAVSQFDISRFAIRLSPLNFLRLWGNLYNYQFESTFPSFLSFLAFVPPITAYLALVIKRKDRMVLFFTILSFLPLIFFMGRNFFLNIPFSNVIRDVSRFMIFSTFSYSVLIAITIDVLINKKNKLVFNRLKLGGHILGYILVVFVVLNSYPFWIGGLYSEARYGYDIRLRTFEFPREYYEVENMLTKNEINSKVLYLPIGGRLGLLNDKRFYGAYHEIADIFSNYSSVPGTITISDKGIGVAQNFVNTLQATFSSTKSLHLADLLGLAGVKLIVIRLNTYFSLEQPSMNEIAHKLETEAGFRKFYKNNSMLVFENMKNLPNIYPATSLIFVGGGISDLPSLVTFDGFQAKNGIFFPGLLENKQKRFILSESNSVLVPISKEKGEAAADKKGSLRPLVKLEDKYRLEIPKKVKYEVLVKKDSFLGRSKDLRVIIGNEEVMAKPYTNSQVAGEWVTVGEVFLEKGKYPLKIWNEGLRIYTIEAGDLILKADNRAQRFSPPKIRFRKINPTKYVVNISEVKDSYHLVFSESFHPGWKAYIRGANGPKSKVQSPKSPFWETWLKKPLSEDKHFLVNGYANDWYIEPKDVDGNESYDIILEFWPQRLFYLGLMISGLTLLGCMGYLVWDWRKRQLTAVH